MPLLFFTRSATSLAVWPAGMEAALSGTFNVKLPFTVAVVVSV